MWHVDVGGRRLTDSARRLERILAPLRPPEPRVLKLKKVNP